MLIYCREYSHLKCSFTAGNIVTWSAHSFLLSPSRRFPNVFVRVLAKSHLLENMRGRLFWSQNVWVDFMYLLQGYKVIKYENDIPLIWIDFMYLLQGYKVIKYENDIPLIWCMIKQYICNSEVVTSKNSFWALKKTFPYIPSLKWRDFRFSWILFNLTRVYSNNF